MIKTGSKVCSYEECEKTFISMNALIEHLDKDHQSKVITENLSFSSEEDFFLWKKQVEHQNVFFVSQRSKKNSLGQTVKYFVCNRSEFEDRRNKGKVEGVTRQLKAQGSCKMGRHCPAQIKLTFNGNEHVVEYRSSHYGHEFNPCHLRIPEKTQEEVRFNLEFGVSREVTTRKLRKILTPSKKKRRHNIITNKDVTNIAKNFALNFKGQLHENDPTSIDMHVEVQKEKKEIIFLEYKKQGSTDFPGLDQNDFLLAFMTPFQKEMIQKLGSQEKTIICMDATHETNGYDFQFVTVLTKDSHGEGLLLAHMFSSRETAVALKYFLKGIKKECGAIKCQEFMSDDADQYFQAWSSVMVEKEDDAPVKLLCAWHVTRSFEKNILSKVKQTKYREFVFHHLKTIMSELDIEKK